MASQSGKHRKPPISIGRSDHERLTRLAESLAEREPVVADQLFGELDRARVVADAKLGAGVVRMGSTLSFTADGGAAKTVTLVFPAEADIASGRISVLTPIGAALIGLSEGQSIDWTARDGRSSRLTVESVYAPATAR